MRFEKIPVRIGIGVLVLIALGTLLMLRAEHRVNRVALSDSPRPVTVVTAQSATFRPHRRYIGTLQPWTSSDIGPQLISAYVDTVLVRPGAQVKQGQVLATLDCKPTSAANRNVAMLARSVEERQRAAAHEANRTESLLDGGFVSPNEAEQKVALSASEESQLEASRAQLERTGLEVRDCILRAPFDGEVSARYVDPGAFVRPGNAVISVVDRNTVRMTADAPEVDFGVVATGTPVGIHIVATGQDINAAISRRSPAADPGTRTMHFEIDLPDPERKIPVGTTGEVHVDVGQPISATRLPLSAASIRGDQANLFVVEATTEGSIAHTRTIPVLGESGGNLFVDPKLPAGTCVVSEGRALLQEGDRVAPKEQTAEQTSEAKR
jgi:RND family efflux transporter MFP subunit